VSGTQGASRLWEILVKREKGENSIFDARGKKHLHGKQRDCSNELTEAYRDKSVGLVHRRDVMGC